MQTVFSHIIQKRLSRENENVATEALAYVLNYSKAARRGMMKLLREVVPQMPDLSFQTQQTEDSSRPDMWGYDATETRVFVENKFWASLTANQPVAYLQLLAKSNKPTVLLFVVPEARVQTIWRELARRLSVDVALASDGRDSAGIAHCFSTGKGPTLALTSWVKLIEVLEDEAKDDQRANSDLFQLRALCRAADTDVPISAEEVSDQRTPALLLQLSSIVKESVERAINEGSLHKGRLQRQANWERIGQYATFSNEHGAGIWLGIHFDLWKSYGGTPLWAVFSPSEWGRSREVRALLEPWAAQKGVFVASQEDESFVVALDIAFGEEKDQVAKRIVDRLREMATMLSGLQSKPTVGASNE